MLTIPNAIGIYDNANYLHHPIVNITGSKFVKLKPEFTAGLLMIKWAPIGRYPLANQPDSNIGTIRITALAGIGNLPPIDFALRIDRTKPAQFIAPDFNGLSYSIELQQQLPVTQFKISEYLYPVTYPHDQSLPMPVPSYPPDGGGENRTGGTIPNPVVTIVANTSPVKLIGADPFRAPDGVIRNYSNKKLYLSYSNNMQPAVSADFDSVPSALGTEPGSIALPTDYEGEVWGIWAGPNPTGSAKISTFTYVQ
jgi:hypothetical protein